MYVDMHSHILPGADHGSDSLETSLSQLSSAVGAGVDTILSTSHFYMHSDTVEEFLKRRQSSFKTLVQGMPNGLKEKISIILGAEVTLEVDLDKLENLEQLCIGDTKNILIEMPAAEWTSWVYETLNSIICKRKLHPIIAHADRYMKINSLDKLIDMGLPLQINAYSVNSFSRRKKLIKLFENGYAMYLGSDVHMLGNEYEEYQNATKRLGDLMEEITMASRIAVGQQKENASPFGKAIKHII